MTLSQDGRYLIVPGFAAAVGQLTNLTGYAFPGISSNASVSGSYATNAVTEADVPRVIGLVDGNGHVYTSTTITNGNEDGDEIRGAASTDGTNIWYEGADGLRVKYTTRGSLVSTQVCALTTMEPTRAVGIFGNTLYIDKNTAFTGATATNVLVNPYGGTNLAALLPTSSIPTNFAVIGAVTNGSQMGFIMFNLANGNGANGVDTLYLADSAANYPGEARNYGGAMRNTATSAALGFGKGALGRRTPSGWRGTRTGRASLCTLRKEPMPTCSTSTIRTGTITYRPDW